MLALVACSSSPVEPDDINSALGQIVVEDNSLEVLRVGTRPGSSQKTLADVLGQFGSLQKGVDGGNTVLSGAKTTNFRKLNIALAYHSGELLSAVLLEKRSSNQLVYVSLLRKRTNYCVESPYSDEPSCHTVSWSTYDLLDMINPTVQQECEFDGEQCAPLPPPEDPDEEGDTATPPSSGGGDGEIETSVPPAESGREKCSKYQEYRSLISERERLVDEITGFSNLKVRYIESLNEQFAVLETAKKRRSELYWSVSMQENRVEIRIVAWLACIRLTPETACVGKWTAMMAEINFLARLRKTWQAQREVVRRLEVSYSANKQRLSEDMEWLDDQIVKDNLKIDDLVKKMKDFADQHNCSPQ